MRDENGAVVPERDDFIKPAAELAMLVKLKPSFDSLGRQSRMRR